MNRPSSEFAPWLRSAALVGGVGAVVSLVWLLPGTPMVLWQADYALSTGSLQEAAAGYDHVAEQGWFEADRLKALDRAASVYADGLGDSQAATLRLERLLALTSVEEERAALRERMAWASSDAGDPLGASTAFVAASEAAPNHPDAAERLVLAARHADEGGDLQTARALWERVVAAHPDRLGTAKLALGRIALAEDAAQEAHAFFRDAAEASDASDVVLAARLGAATALERLGSLDGAIAEIDDSELPEDVAESRLDALRSRREARDR